MVTNYLKNLEEVITHLVPLIFEELKKVKTMQSFISLMTCLSKTLILLSIFIEKSKTLIELLETIQVLMLEVINRLTEFIRSSNNNVLSSEVVQSMQAIVVWLDINFEIITKRNPEVNNYFIISSNTMSIVFQVMGIMCSDSENLFSTTKIEDLDNIVNHMKGKCLALINEILKGIYSSKLSPFIFPIYTECREFSQKVIKTLTNKCDVKSDALELVVNHKESAMLIVRMLEFLEEIVKDSNFFDTFDGNKGEIMIKCLLMLLATNETDVKIMEDQPEDFVNLAIDICTEQSSKIPKTEAAKLLNKMCLHIDSFAYFAATLCCEIFKHGCREANPKVLKCFEILSKFQNNSVFLLTTPPEFMTDTAILIMTLITRSTSRNDIKVKFEQTLREFYGEVFNGSSIMIKSRLALLIGYSDNTIFKDEYFMRTVKFLFEGVLQRRKVPVFVLQCANSLKNIIDHLGDIPESESTLCEAIAKFCEVIPDIELESVYNVLRVIIKKYPKIIRESLEKMIETLINIVKSKYIHSQHNTSISHCCNLLITICEQKAFFPDFMDNIENAVMPVLELLNNPDNIWFGDEIIQMITQLINNRKSISNNMKLLFLCLIKNYNKHKELSNNLLKALNAYIYHGKELFATLKEWIEVIIKISIESLLSNGEVIIFNNTKGAILSQILLQCIGKGALDAYIPFIIEKIVYRFSASVTGNFLIRELYNVLLCAVSNNAHLALQQIETLGMTKPIFSHLFELASSYKNLYDIKVLTIGLSNLFIRPLLPPYLNECRVKILEVVIDVLKRQVDIDMSKLIKEDSKALPMKIEFDMPFLDVPCL